MEFASLGSGSEGNATLLKALSGNGGTLLVDCGFSAKETLNRLSRLGTSVQDIAAILVTHEHTDHIKGVARLANRFKIPVYATWGTWFKKLSGHLDPVLYRQILPEQGFLIGDISIQAVPVPHDAREPCQFIFESAGLRLGLLTDVGSITPHMIERYQCCDGLMLEFNHDLQMLQDGPYPANLKRRVAGPLGHLNNGQASHLLKKVASQRLQSLVATHVSQKNNHPDLVLETILEAKLCSDSAVTLATQREGFNWMGLQSRNSN